MKIFTILGTGWLGLELAKRFKSKYKIKVSSRNEENLSIYEEEGFSSYILNEENFDFLEELLNTNYLFINFPPSKFDDYLVFLDKIYNHQKIKSIEKIIFISSTSIYPNVEYLFKENFKIENPSTKIVYDAEKLIESRSDVIFRVSALVGANRIPGRRFSGKVLESPKTRINFVHRDDVIAATEYVITNNLNGIYNLCSVEHPTKEDLYTSNAKKYGFQPPLCSNNEESLNRLIDGSKISKAGFMYKYNDAFDLD